MQMMDVREPERREREQHMSVALDCISRQWVVPAGAAHVSRLRRTWVILGANELCPRPGVESPLHFGGARKELCWRLYGPGYGTRPGSVKLKTRRMGFFCFQVQPIIS